MSSGVAISSFVHERWLNPDKTLRCSGRDYFPICKYIGSNLFKISYKDKAWARNLNMNSIINDYYPSFIHISLPLVYFYHNRRRDLSLCQYPVLSDSSYRHRSEFEAIFVGFFLCKVFFSLVLVW